MPQKEDGITLRQAVAAAIKRLAKSASSLNARRDAEHLLMHAAGFDRAFLVANPASTLAPGVLARYDEYIERRSSAEPIQYIVGEQEFFGLRFEVSPDVLIPRPETEHLVEALLSRVPHDRALHIADVGTGSGAIAVAAAYSLPNAKIVALDLSKAALRVAGWNAQQHGVANRIRFLESDLLNAVGEECFDVIVSNPPYVAETERESLEEQVRGFEPNEALFAGPTGLEVYERLIPQAHVHLRAGGWLLMEIGEGQQKQIERLLKTWSEVSFTADLQGIPRVAIARRKQQ
jgi:release factor glutamine methyltransferase